MTITLMTTSLIGLLLFILSGNVIRLRQKTQTNLGTGGDQRLERACRAQGNLIEYAPICLMLIGLLEYMQANHFLVLGLGIALVVARVAQGYGLAFSSKDISPFRVIGTLLTFVVLVTGSVAGLVVAYG